MSSSVLTPSAVNNYLKTILEKDKYLKMFDIKGELSNLKYHSNGNVYFSIKDANASINCILFAKQASKISLKFSEGDKVTLTGALYLYVKMGQYNINVLDMKKTGTGDLYAKFEQLKEKLRLQGYFDEVHKKPIPKYPNEICIITSSTGAAIEDIVTTIKRRYPVCKINLLSTLVQGEKGAKDIVDNLKYANTNHLGDVIIVGRGGGSIEDLWNFNEEIVVKAIFDSDIPIISSVGHETDFTLSDFAADIRAATPTAAAEIATPYIKDLFYNLQQLKSQSVDLLKNKVKQKRLELRLIEENQYFINPLIDKQMRFDSLTNEFENSSDILSSKVKINRLDLQNIFKQLNDTIVDTVNNKREKFEKEKIVLDELNPLTILSKGYSVSYARNNIIKSINDVEINDVVETKLKDGVLITTVMEKKDEKII